MPRFVRKGRVVFGGLCFVALAHALFYPALFTNDYSTRAIVLYEVPSVAAVLAVLYRLRGSTGKDRQGWWLMLAAVAATGLLDTAWSIAYRLNGDELPYPNWFDPFYLSTYACYIAAIGMLCSPLWRGGDRRWMFDAGALMAISAGLLWHFVVPQTSDGSTLESALGVAYLVFDLGFLGTVLSALYTTRLTFRNGLILLAALTLATGDALYYFNAGAFDASWLIGTWLLVLAAAGNQGAEIRLRRPRFAHTGAVPYILVAAVGAVTLVELQRSSADDLLLASVLALGLVVGRQIVSLRQALAVQRAETAFREAVLEAQSDLGLGIAILEGRRVIYANEAAERITGYTVPELRGMDSVAEMFDGADTPEWYRWLEHPELPAETAFARSDGSRLDLEIVARPMTGGAEPRLLLVARDVTARRQEQQALVQAQKFEGLGALAGGVAHDFNNLLSTVLGNVGLLRMGELDGEAAEIVASIESAAKRGAEMTRTLLDFSRTQPERFAIEDLRDCLAETASLARPALPVNVALHVDAGQAAVFARINRGLLIQALLNLVLNARDAVGQSGDIFMGLAEKEGAAELVVRDSGAGMDQATMNRIFEPFFTTKHAGAGTGLGLAITQRSIREHGGQVRVDSAPGAGTAITISLPLAVFGASTAAG